MILGVAGSPWHVVLVWDSVAELVGGLRELGGPFGHQPETRLCRAPQSVGMPRWARGRSARCRATEPKTFLARGAPCRSLLMLGMDSHP